MSTYSQAAGRHRSPTIPTETQANSQATQGNQSASSTGGRDPASIAKAKLVLDRVLKDLVSKVGILFVEPCFLCGVSWSCLVPYACNLLLIKLYKTNWYTTGVG